MVIMKKVLDIGCSEGQFMLKDSMKHPNRAYVGCDIEPQFIMTNSPDGVYNLLKAFSLIRAHHLYPFRKEDQRLKDLIMNSRGPTRYTFPDKKQYQEVLDDTIGTISEFEKGRKILSTKVGEVFNPNFSFNPLIAAPSPGLYRMTIKEFLESNPPASFRDYVQQYTDRIHFLLADGRSMPFQDRIFDYSLADGVPVHEDFNTFVSEAARVTKKGGRVLISWMSEEFRQEYPEGFEIDI